MLCIVSVLQACTSDDNSPYYCKGAPLRDVNEVRDETFLYDFTINGVSFKISRADLVEFNIVQSRSIVECVNPALSSLSLKLPNDFAGSIIDTKKTLFVILEGRLGPLHNFNIPVAEHIETQRDRLFSDENRLVIPLEFRSLNDNYYCKGCKPFFDFPVMLDIKTPLGDKYEPAVYNSVTGEFTGDFNVLHRTVIMTNGPYKNLLGYNLALRSGGVEFSGLPKVFVEVEKKLKSWIQ